MLVAVRNTSGKDMKTPEKRKISGVREGEGDKVLGIIKYLITLEEEACIYDGTCEACRATWKGTRGENGPRGTCQNRNLNNRTGHHRALSDMVFHVFIYITQQGLNIITLLYTGDMTPRGQRLVAHLEHSSWVSAP